ncbi:MAG: hypothetical protein M3167_06360 [Acidobacteriota bacterium]|nr:hypothetical protein [Acidobacteriota bacterium]
MRPILAALAGAVVLIVWGMLFWGFLAPPLGVFHALPNAPQVTAALAAGGAPTGTYFMPWPRRTPDEFRRFVAQHRSGPFYRVTFVREGVDPSSPGKILAGCALDLTVSAIAVALLAAAGAASSARRFRIVLLAGLLGSAFITVGDPVWFHMPWDYVRGVLIYEVVSWFLLAATLAWLAKPARDRAMVRYGPST